MSLRRAQKHAWHREGIQSLLTIQVTNMKNQRSIISIMTILIISIGGGGDDDDSTLSSYHGLAPF